MKTKDRRQATLAGRAWLAAALVCAPSLMFAQEPPTTRPAAVAKPAAKPAAARPAPQPSAPPPATTEADDLRMAIGINPTGLRRVDVPRVPSMTMRGYVQPRGSEPMALLEITESNRIYLVQKGTQIPVTVTGKVSPIGHAELTGLSDAAKPAAAPSPADDKEQSQIILKVVGVSREGVTVETGTLAQTMVIR